MVGPLLPAVLLDGGAPDEHRVQHRGELDLGEVGVGLADTKRVCSMLTKLDARISAQNARSVDYGGPVLAPA